MLGVALAVIAAQLVAGWAGFQICRATHRQRGLDVDSFTITYGPTGAGRH